MRSNKDGFVCTECGYVSASYMGRCPSCRAFQTMVEWKRPRPEKEPDTSTFAAPAPLSAHVKPAESLLTGISELESVLGGGLVAGSVVLAGGEPGIGKSTLFLQAASVLSAKTDVLYVSGEESAAQVALRRDRLKLKQDIMFLADNILESAVFSAEKLGAKVLFIDSIQTLTMQNSDSAPGSVSQVRECAAALADFARRSACAVVLIGHVTKDGAIAGPRVLEHLVDTVLYFEGERHTSLRVLRAVKNRFGSTNEIGVFEMTGEGMREVNSPSAAMLSLFGSDAAGACLCCAVEGTRPVLLEVEALVSRTSFGNPRRMSTGVDHGRMSMIIAVLEKKIGLKLFDQDIFLNVGGGMRLSEPGIDLAVAAAIVSSLRNRAVAKGTVIFGEIALTGELRPVSRMEQRIAEAARMGMKRVVAPGAGEFARDGIECIDVTSVYEMLSAVLAKNA